MEDKNRQNSVGFDCRIFPSGLNTLDNARENEIRLQLYQSYKQDRIYRCGEFDHMSFHIHVLTYCGTVEHGSDRLSKI